MNTTEKMKRFSLATVPLEGVEAPPGSRKASAIATTDTHELVLPAMVSPSVPVGKGLIQKICPPASYLCVDTGYGIVAPGTATGGAACAVVAFAGTTSPRSKDTNQAMERQAVPVHEWLPTVMVHRCFFCAGGMLEPEHK